MGHISGGSTAGRHPAAMGTGPDRSRGRPTAAATFTESPPAARSPEPAITADGVHVTLRMTDPTSQLDAVHEALQRFLEQLKRPPAHEWQLMFELAVSEIAANVIEHVRPPLIHFRVAAEPNGVVAEFTDTGRGWESPPRPAPRMDQLVERGRGLSLART
ncbi:MAG: ATP-binding protein, partial [Actinobacteria bacterium]|nr:ATP-binding protein [Actinomycetota bacterium]